MYRVLCCLFAGSIFPEKEGTGGGARGEGGRRGGGVGLPSSSSKSRLIASKPAARVSLRTSTRADWIKTYLQGECSYRRADVVRRFNVGRTLVHNTPLPDRWCCVGTPPMMGPSIGLMPSFSPL